MKKILILGSSGSIGVNTLNVLREFKDEYEVVGLSVATNIHTLIAQCREFKPRCVYIENHVSREKFKSMTAEIKVYGDTESDIANFVIENDFDILVNAFTGSSGFIPTIEAIKKGKTVALANKETLVVGGEIIMPLAKKYGVDIIPIDSEHSAIFQIVRHFGCANIEKLIITASGGPFYDMPKEKFSSITLEDALKHPTWNMGNKITIDSATMMNKGFEVIEAHHLFGMPYEKIETIVHPQSIIHSLVEFIDGEIYAQLGITDMKYPIQNALTYPEIKNTPFGKLTLSDIKEMTFYKTDMDKFPMLSLAYKCGSLGGLTTTALNAANEIAVSAFLGKKIKFTDIYPLISKMCENVPNEEVSFENIIEFDKEVRAKTKEAISKSYLTS